MAVTSFRNAAGADASADSALMKMAGLLFDGIVHSAVQANPEDYAHFRIAIEEVAGSFDKESSVAELASKIQSSLKLLGEYNQRTDKYLHLQATEFRILVKMLTNALNVMAAPGAENVRRLRDFDRRVESAANTEDIRDLKVSLTTCLNDIRQEVERRHAGAPKPQEPAEASEETAAETAPSAPPPPAAVAEPEFDHITGLPGKAFGEAALTMACSSKIPTYAVIAVVNHLKEYNQQHGFAVGDQVLVCFKDLLKRQLRAEDKLFRWTGPAVLVLLERACRPDMVKNEVGRILDQKVERTIRTETKIAMLSISARWTIFPMCPTPKLLLRKIDSFASL